MKKELQPQDCDGETAYFLKLQKERLDKKGLKLHESVVPSKGTSYGTGKVSRKSLWYTTDMMYENVSRKLSFLKMRMDRFMSGIRRWRCTRSWHIHRMRRRPSSSA